MSAPVKITYGAAVLTGIALLGLWWLGRRSLMQKRHMEIASVLAAQAEPPPTSLPAEPPPAALPAG